MNNKYWNALNLCKIPEGNSYLDCNISVDEISKACLKLKNNKANGMDSILNEMLKHGQWVLLPSLEKLFNLVLDSGIYPRNWSIDYIFPIY